jgi:peptide/nickel transport system substrate-binding protein
MIKQRALSFAVGCVLILLIPGGLYAGAGAQKGTAQTSQSKTLTIAMGADLKTFDPANHNATTTNAIITNMTSLLFRKADNLDVRPELVTKYDIVDTRTWRMTIRNDVVFHNGDKLTSADVKYTLERAASDKSLTEYPLFRVIREVKIIDEYNFDIITFDPYPALPSLLAKFGGDILPKKYIEEKGFDYFLSHPVYSGPYELVERIRDDRVVLKPFDKFYGGGAANWDQVIFRAIPEPSTRVAELLTGNVDIITDVPPNEWSRVDNNSGLTSVVRGDTTRVYILILRMSPGRPLADARVREAIELAINKQQICDSLLQGAGVPTRTRVGNGVPGFEPSLYNTNIYNPAKAKQLLSEAGYANGLTLEMTSSRGRYLMDSEVAQMVTAMLAEAGITIKLEALEYSVFSAMYSAKKNKDIFMIGLSDSFFNARYALTHYSKNRAAGETDYYNPKVEELYNDALSNMDIAKGDEECREIQLIVAEERPHVNICQLQANYGVNKRVSFTPRGDEVFNLSSISLK